jgi:hypothetical protein
MIKAAKAIHGGDSYGNGDPGGDVDADISCTARKVIGSGLCD